jgi:hypothetical protein
MGIRKSSRHSRNRKRLLWFALSCSEVLGPIFFAEQTVTVMTYRAMLQLYLLPQLEVHEPDGAPPDWACIAREFLIWCLGLNSVW